VVMIYLRNSSSYTVDENSEMERSMEKRRGGTLLCLCTCPVCKDTNILRKNRSDRMNNWRQIVGQYPLRGAIGGTIGTVPMTLFMLAMHRLLPRWQRYALPPEEITHEAAEKAHVREHMTKEQVLG